MASSTGVLLPPMGYLKPLREICDRIASRAGAPGFFAMSRAWEAGLMIRQTGDIIQLSLPFIISEDRRGV